LIDASAEKKKINHDNKKKNYFFHLRTSLFPT